MNVLQADIMVPARAQLGEGALWDDRTNALVWLDTPTGDLHTFDPATGARSTFAIAPPLSTICLRDAGGYVLTHGRRPAVLERLGDEIRDGAEHIGLSHILNDGSIDAAGRLWAGTARRRTLKPPAHDLAEDVPDEGGFFCIGADLTLTRVIDDVTTCNGIDWTADGRTMYAVMDAQIRIFDFDIDGPKLRQRGVVTIPHDHGEPDGAILDAEDMLWVAFYGTSAVRRYSPDGTVLAEVPLPARLVTSCAFGGDDLATLFVTTGSWGASPGDDERYPHAGSVFAVRPGVVGRTTNRFIG